MTTRAEDNLMDWLRDAHAMQEQAEQMPQITRDFLLRDEAPNVTAKH